MRTAFNQNDSDCNNREGELVNGHGLDERLRSLRPCNEGKTDPLGHILFVAQMHLDRQPSPNHAKYILTKITNLNKDMNPLLRHGTAIAPGMDIIDSFIKWIRKTSFFGYYTT